MGRLRDWLRRRGQDNADHALGRRGEKIARRLLSARGLKTLATNYRGGGGEIDLICLDRRAAHETVVFVEVKTRTSDAWTDPDAAVDADKRRRVQRAAEHYTARRDLGDADLRFDIVSVVIRPGAKPEARHVENAF